MNVLKQGNGFGNTVDFADEHRASAIFFRQSATSHRRCCVGYELVERLALVEGARGVRHEVEAHVSVLEDYALGTKLAAKSSERDNLDKFLSLAGNGPKAVQHPPAELLHLLVTE